MNSLIPQSLVKDIREGRCVAFVGAGFSQVAGLPDWDGLIRALATAPELDQDTREALDRLLTVTPKPEPHVLDEVAQRISDSLGHERFQQVLGREMRPKTGTDQTRFDERLRLLRGIPFRAILTLNFDGLLGGERPEKAVYGKMLRERVEHWDGRFWQQDAGAAGLIGAPVVSLHGSIASDPPDVVLTRRGYRAQVHGDAAYLPFLRAMFAGHTILYLGYSFSDPYLHELRSELLSLFGDERDPALGYAFFADADAERCNHWRAHEGIELIRYSSESSHAGFDLLLRTLHDETHPVAELARSLRGKRILWLDPHPENHAEVHPMLLKHLQHEGVSGRPEIAQVGAVDDAVAQLGESEWDLVLTHWGEGDAPDGSSNAEALLGAIRRDDRRVPVIVFSRDENTAARKRTVLGLGAIDYTTTHIDLFRAMVRVFS